MYTKSFAYLASQPSPIDKILFACPNLPIPFSTVLAIHTYFSPLVILLTAAWMTPGLVSAEYTFHLGQAPPYLGISIPDKENLFEIFPAGNISKRFSLSGIDIPRYGGACPRWNVYSALTRPGVIQAAVSKMTNGEKYVCIARTVEKGIGRFGQAKSILSIGLGCEAKYAKDFVYTENVNINDKSTEIPIGVSCRTCDRLDCSQRAFPPLHKKFDIDINTRGVSVYVTDENS